MKYAIVESGGKQYRAVEGSTIEVDLLQTPKGEQVLLEVVLAGCRRRKCAGGYAHHQRRYCSDDR